jgi:hypothetical protein
MTAVRLTPNPMLCCVKCGLPTDIVFYQFAHEASGDLVSGWVRERTSGVIPVDWNQHDQWNGGCKHVWKDQA